MNDRVDQLITVLKIEQKSDSEGKKYYDTKNGSIYQRNELRDLIRRTLGIDKKCFQCDQWKFDGELVEVEDTGSFVCEECAKKIISGEVKLREYE